MTGRVEEEARRDTEAAARETQPAVAGAGRTPAGLAAGLSTVVGRFGVVVVLAAMIAVFSALTPDTFPTTATATTIAGDNTIVLLAALAGLVPLIVGEFDLSIGNVLGLSTVVTASLTAHHHFGVVPAGLVAIAIGGGIGAVSGFLITKMNVSSFIATLGAGTVVGGVALAISGGKIQFTGLPDNLLAFGQGNIGSVPKISFVALGALLLLWYITEHTPLGRRLYAVGMGRDAARLAGVPPEGLIFGAFVFSGAVSAFAGVLELGRVGAAHPDIGPDFLLPALAAAFLGATTIRPGRFNVWGTAIAVILVAVGTTGLQLNGAPFWVEPVFNGGVLLVAVTLSEIAARRGRAV